MPTKGTRSLQQSISHHHLQWLGHIIRFLEIKQGKQTPSREFGTLTKVETWRPSTSPLLLRFPTQCFPWRTLWKDGYARRSTHGHQLGRHGRHRQQDKRAQQLEPGFPMCIKRNGLRSQARYDTCNVPHFQRESAFH